MQYPQLLSAEIRHAVSDELSRGRLNYYDHERRTAGDNPTLGLILCTDKNDAVVKYAWGPDQSKRIFTSRYKLHLPSEAELRKELRREVRQLTRAEPRRKPRKKKNS